MNLIKEIFYFVKGFFWVESFEHFIDDAISKSTAIEDRTEIRTGVGHNRKSWTRYYIDGERVTYAQYYDFVHPHRAPHKNVITDELYPIEDEIDEFQKYN